MTDKNPAEAGLIISDAEMKAALAVPDTFRDFLRRFKMTTKYQRQADETYIQVHQEARRVIIAVEGAPNREALIMAVRSKSDLSEAATLADLVLDALIEYKEKDKSARSRDKGIQAYLARRPQISVEAVITTINDLGGMHETYLANCRENPKAKPTIKKRQSLTKAAALKACPNGGKMLALLDVDKSGKVSILQYLAMGENALSQWDAIIETAEKVAAADPVMKGALASKAIISKPVSAPASPTA